MATASFDTISVRPATQRRRAVRAWPLARIIDTLLSVDADLSVTQRNGAHSLHTLLIINARPVDVILENSTVRSCAHVVQTLIGRRARDFRTSQNGVNASTTHTQSWSSAWICDIVTLVSSFA